MVVGDSLPRTPRREITRFSVLDYLARPDPVGEVRTLAPVVVQQSRGAGQDSAEYRQQALRFWCRDPLEKEERGGKSPPRGGVDR